MKKVKFTGWEEGMKKIPFTKLLHEEGGMTLKDAKEVCDGILNEVNFTIEFKDEKTARRIFNKAIEYKVICELTEK